MEKTMGIEYSNNKVAGEIKAMMMFAWESSTEYPYFRQWGELNPNDVNDIIWRVTSQKQSVHDAIIYVVGPAMDPDFQDYLENHDWNISAGCGSYDFQWFTPAGEDFHLDIDTESPISDFMFQCENFDVNEHVKIWIESLGQKGVPNTVRELLEDGEAIEEKLLRDADNVSKLDLKGDND